MNGKIRQLTEDLTAECHEHQTPMVIALLDPKTGETIHSVEGKMPDVAVLMGTLFVRIEKKTKIDAVELAETNVALVKEMQKDFIDKDKEKK